MLIRNLPVDATARMALAPQVKPAAPSQPDPAGPGDLARFFGAAVKFTPKGGDDG